MLLNDDNDEATGVEFVAADGSTHTVAASREVILCAGAYGSPQLLLQSGVGDAAELRAAGVRPRVQSPGVGRHLQDHPIVGLKYRLGAVGGAWWPVSLTKMTAFLNLPDLFGYAVRGTGTLASSGVDFGLFAATDEERFAGRPDCQVHGFPTAGDRSFFEDFLHYRADAFTSEIGVASDLSPLFAQGLALGPTLLHARASGSVRLRGGGAALTAAPVVEYEAYADEDDLRRMTRCIRIAEEVMAQPAMQAHAPQLLYHRGLAAELGEGTDAYWRAYLQRFGFVVYHPTGTCRMGFAGDGVDSVVDGDLRVMGVARLRVADASIMPDIVSGNTQVPTAAIAMQVVRMLEEVHGGN